MPRPHARASLMVFRIASIALAGAWLASTALAQTSAEETLQLVSTVPAPWTQSAGAAPRIDGTLQLTARALRGGSPLRCSPATYRFVRTPAEGLFEGMLPAPAEDSARSLGVAGAVLTQRIECANAAFDLHRTTDGRAWLALDNHVLEWRRAKLAASPVAAVQSLLIDHFARRGRLSEAALTAQSVWLTDALVRKLVDWLARAAASDEAPYLSGDPYTDNQEPPDSFQIRTKSMQGARADIVVAYEGAHTEPYEVHFLLARTRDGWRIEDLRYRDGETLSALLER
jgi:hypothetical protein